MKMIGTIVNVILVVIGLACFCGGIVTIKEGIQKRNGKSFSEGAGMLVFGIITVLWICKSLF